jgi:sarcosine oxidase subunit gamma
LASVSEQSAGYAVLRLRGPGAAELLQKGAFIDLDPRVFAVGDAAVTVIAHIGVVLWKVDDAPTFDVAVFRSLLGSFQDWIAAASVGAVAPT